MARAGFATTKQASSSQADDERLQDSSDRIQQASQQEGQATKQDGKQTDSQKQGSGSSVGKGRELQTQAVGAASAGTTQKSSSNAGEVVAQGKGRDLYVASGLLAYATPEQKAGLFEFLQPFASKVHYKELYLAQASGTCTEGTMPGLSLLYEHAHLPGIPTWPQHCLHLAGV
jgi:hypothetical protein